VLIKIVERCRSESWTFIAEELAGRAVSTARHPFGCALMCQIVAFCPPDNIPVRSLLYELINNAWELCDNEFGISVIRSILWNSDLEDLIKSTSMELLRRCSRLKWLRHAPRLVMKEQITR